jgi:hypothetical protein
MKTPFVIRFVICSFLPLTFFAGCGGTEVLSHRMQQGSLVETSAASWSGVTPLSSKNHYFLSLAHDSDALFVRLSFTQEGMQRQVMRSGLVLWVDPKGGTAKTLGIHYPLAKEPGISGESEFDRSLPEIGGRNGSSSSPGGLEMEILGPDGKSKERMLVSQGDGIRVSLNRTAEEFTYTARLPFARFPELAEGASSSAGRTLGLGVELNPATPSGRKPGAGMRGEGSGGVRGETPDGEGMEGSPDGDGMSRGRMEGERGGRGMRQRPGEGPMGAQAIGDWYRVLLKD